MFLQLGFEIFKQGKGIGGATGKTGDDAVVVEAAYLAGIALHDGITQRNLANGTDDHLVAAAH